MAQQKALDAALCRQLARSFSSPYYRYAAWSIEEGDRSARDVLMSQGLKAYTFDKLPPLMQAFLKLCDRSVVVHRELFDGKPTGLTTKEEDDRVIQKMIQQGDIEEEDGDDEDF